MHLLVRSIYDAQYLLILDIASDFNAFIKLIISGQILKGEHKIASL